MEADSATGKASAEETPKEAPRKVTVDWTEPSSPFIGTKDMKGRTASVDFETFYSTALGYTLKKMTPYQYVNDPRFDAYMVAIESDLGEVFIGRPETFHWGSLEGSTLAMHNASFDGMVLNRLIELGRVPDFKRELVCTADMAAYLNRPRNLKDATECLLGVKMSKAVRAAMDGVTYDHILARGPKAVEELLAYAGDDAKHCLAIYLKYGDQFPAWERQVSKCNREAGWAGIFIDVDLLEKGLATLKGELWKAQQELPWIEEGRKEGSTVALADHARSLGLDVPKSFKKDDPEMMEWVARYADDYPFIKARLTLASLKPHIARLESLKEITGADGLARIPTKFFGCHTGRASGASESASKFNILNIPRDKVYGVDMRAVLLPRRGYKFAIYDFAQIESRIVQWMAGATEFLDTVKREGNIYQVAAKSLGWCPPEEMDFKNKNKEGYRLAKACLSEETLVLTDAGYKRIVDVLATERVWDGRAWVAHEGVTCNGHRTEKDLVSVNGERFTRDHGIYNGPAVGDRETAEASSAFWKRSSCLGWRQSSMPVSGWDDLRALVRGIWKSLAKEWRAACSVQVSKLRKGYFSDSDKLEEGAFDPVCKVRPRGVESCGINEPMGADTGRTGCKVTGPVVCDNGSVQEPVEPGL